MMYAHGSEKKVGDLTFDDFRANPIWTWAEDDDDESLVMPLHYTRTLPSEDEMGDVFVKCKFSFQDGTQTDGVLSVHLNDHRVYLLEFEIDGELYGFPLRSELEGTVTREQLATKLGKRTEDVFPVMYDTPFVFSDGSLLKGKIK